MVKPTVDIIKTTLTNPSLKSSVVFLSQLKNYNVFMAWNPGHQQDVLDKTLYINGFNIHIEVILEVLSLPCA